MAPSTTGSEVSEGPVLNLMNKRLRALRKKYNRILQLEENIAQGKKINKEQEEVLHSKISVVVLIDEYEKLRQPLASAVQEELKLSADPSKEALLSNGFKVKKGCVLNGHQSGVAVDERDGVVEDLVGLLYFGNLFDVKTPSDFSSTMVSRTHERRCCLSYVDVGGEDSCDLLGEKDLDLISMLGGSLVSRPIHSSDSHKSALRSCVERAKLWVSSSEQPVENGGSVTYAGLKERLNRILASEYLTASPMMESPVEVVAAAGSYVEPVPLEIHDETEVVVVSVENHEQKEEIAVQETVIEQSIPAELITKDESQEVPNVVDVTPALQDQILLQDVAGDQNQGDIDPEEEPFIPVGRSNRNQRNNRGNNGGGGGGGGGRRGFYGRGGRGSRGGGGYQNGYSQYSDQPGNGYPNNYSNRRGRGDRGEYSDQPGNGYPNNYSNRRGRGDRGGGGGGRGQSYNNRGNANQNGHAPPADVQAAQS